MILFGLETLLPQAQKQLVVACHASELGHKETCRCNVYTALRATLGSSLMAEGEAITFSHCPGLCLVALSAWRPILGFARRWRRES